MTPTKEEIEQYKKAGFFEVEQKKPKLKLNFFKREPEEIKPKNPVKNPYTEPRTALNLFKKNHKEINRLKRKVRERDFVIRKLINEILKRLDE